MIIDAHHHFWNYDPQEYDWITEEMRVIRKSFLPLNLKEEISSSGVDGVITVQARQSAEETEWLLKLAAENDFIKGVTGWIPLADTNAEKVLERFSLHPHLKAIRHVLQGESNEYMLRRDFNKGVDLLGKFNLAYEILIIENQLKHSIRFADLHPDQVLILDHIAKPKIREGIISPWKEDIRELSKRPNVFCKISGMVTEADSLSWTGQQLQPYFEEVLNSFGPARLLFGSDWPVCLVACSYNQWISTVRSFISKLSPGEQAAIMGENAIRVYRLDYNPLAH